MSQLEKAVTAVQDGVHHWHCPKR